MTVRHEFPRAIRTLESVWIPMSDGTRLSARIWLPEDAEEDPVPAILEYIPYRKNDGTAMRDRPMHAYFAGHGYAAVRVDQRGTGDSDGIIEDEYLPLEQSDGLEVLSWLAAQPWCTGRCGIIGKSWGGFNGLQIAAHGPPELCAVVSVASTDDRYADDVHYMGGCLLAWDMVSWASTMLIYNARPPDPEAVGESWRERWLDRLERTPPFLEEWVAHQRRDEFWKQGSVCEDYSAISCPVYMVGGWGDAYRNAILRFLEGHPGSNHKGLIGPWGHVYPHDGAPGPAIGFLQECVRWWDHWLKGADNGIMDEPRLRVWMQDAVRPAARYAERPGRWVAEPGWPAPSLELRRFELGAGTLGAEAGGAAVGLDIRGAQAAGVDAGAWCGAGDAADAPVDQRMEDGLSLTFDSAPLGERLEILGFPELELALASDRTLALVAVRLCDVWPDGSSTLVSRGLLNLTHRDGHEHTEPLEPGRRYVVSVRLNSVAYGVPPGHRLRIAVSPTYWPWAWPSPEPVTLSVFADGESALVLPLRGPVADGDVPEHFAHPESAPPPPAELQLGPETGFEVRREQASGEVELVRPRERQSGVRFLDSGLEYADSSRDVYRIVEGQPLSASVRAERTVSIARGDWRTRVESLSTMSSTERDFHLTNQVDAYEGEVRVFTRTWHRRIPRDHV